MTRRMVCMVFVNTTERASAHGCTMANEVFSYRSKRTRDQVKQPDSDDPRSKLREYREANRVLTAPDEPFMKAGQKPKPKPKKKAAPVVHLPVKQRRKPDTVSDMDMQPFEYADE